MSSSNASIAYDKTLDQISNLIFQLWCYTLLVLGLIGHLLNFYVFTRPILWSNPCARYFFSASISGICVTCFNVPTRLLQNSYQINIFNQSEERCRILTYLNVWIRAQTSWFLVLACLDRFLCSSTSAAVRKWSNIRATSYMIFLAILLIGLAYVNVPIYFQLTPVSKTCIPMQGSYQTFYGIWSLIVFGLSPSILMLLFGMLTIKHTLQAKRQVIPSNSRRMTGEVISQVQTRRKTVDKQMIRMMIIQCAVFIVTATPTSVNFIYTSIKPTVTTDVVAVAQANFVSRFVGLLSFTGPCVSFYLFTLSSVLFRREIARLFTSIFH